jgi:uncharacterized protein (TIGR04255 family)
VPDGEGTLPEYERVLLESPPLELSMCQLRFPPLTRFDEPGYLGAVQSDLLVDYPLASEGREMNIVVTAEGVSQAPAGRQLRFSSIDRRWTVILTKDFVALETRQYTSIEDFSQRFRAVVELVTGHFQILHQLRFGLRYINELRHPTGTTLESWRRLLNEEIFGARLEDLLDATAEQTIEEARLLRADGTMLIRHGFLTGTTVLPDPTASVPKSGPFYLLDLDYYDEQPRTFELNEPIEKMRTFNDTMYRLFRWVIGDGDLYHHLLGQ